MNRIVLLILAVVPLLSNCTTAAAEGIEVRDAWIRPAAKGGNGAVYFVIRSSATDEIVSISSDAAAAVEIHESRMNGDVMEMRQLESVPLAEGQEVTFEPGGMHIMLVGLQQELKAGDEIQITLHFKNYEDTRLSVPVQDTPAAEHEH